MEFSLVSTVFNERKRLEQTIADLEAQTLQPSEIVITDAGSTDGTREMLLEWQQRSKVPVVLLYEEGCNVARGRNLAIGEACYDVIASTDFGCRFKPGWLQSIVAPLFEDESLDVVGGAFSVLPLLEPTLAQEADWVLQAGYPVRMDEHFSVSSRSIAYRRRVWEQIGGYEEWLTLAADDTIFWRLVRCAGFRYRFVQEPMVFWLRHTSFKAFAREAYRYGLGDGESLINARNTLVHTVEWGMRVFSLLMWPWALWWPWILLPGVLSLRGWRSHYWAWRNWRGLWKNARFGILPAAWWLIELSRWQYLRGYFKGWLWANDAQKRGRKLLARRLNC